MGLRTYEKIAVVEANGGLRIETYNTRLQMVLAEMDNGKIADGIYGSEKHLQSLAVIALQIKAIKRKILNHNRPSKQLSED